MRRDRWEDLCALAAEQHAAFTTAQAAELGIDVHALTRLKRDRLIDRIRRGAWAVLALLDEWTPMAALQLCQPRATATGRASAALHAFDGVESLAMDVLVPRNARLRGANVHHVSDLVVPEIVVVEGLRCTDDVRTLIEYAALVDDEHLERAMESVFRRDPGARARLVDRATALKRPGKRGPDRALRVAASLPDVRTESDLETVYWQTLVRYGVPLPSRQVRFGQYCFDLAYEPEWLFVELDGYAHHRDRVAFVRDRHRQNAAVARGWAPLRFTDSDVRNHGRRTAMQTLEVLRRRRAELAALGVA